MAVRLLIVTVSSCLIVPSVASSTGSSHQVVMGDAPANSTLLSRTVDAVLGTPLWPAVALLIVLGIMTGIILILIHQRDSTYPGDAGHAQQLHEELDRVQEQFQELSQQDELEEPVQDRLIDLIDTAEAALHDDRHMEAEESLESIRDELRRASSDGPDGH